MLHTMSRAPTFVFLAALVLLASCGGRPPEGSSRIAVLGDSMMAWNGLHGASTPQVLSARLQEPVTNFAVSGAMVNNPLPISSTLGFELKFQYRDGPWEVIVVNGGANDFLVGCGCRRCERRLARLISQDGQTGELPRFLLGLRDRSGARIIYVGYHRARGLNSPARHCRDELDELEARVERLANMQELLSFVSLKTVFPSGDASFYERDRIHPSPKGSAAIADALLPAIRAALERSVD